MLINLQAWTEACSGSSVQPSTSDPRANLLNVGTAYAWRIALDCVRGDVMEACFALLARLYAHHLSMEQLLR